MGPLRRTRLEDHEDQLGLVTSTATGGHQQHRDGQVRHHLRVAFSWPLRAFCYRFIARKQPIQEYIASSFLDSWNVLWL